jgi:hypothetical protein
MLAAFVAMPDEVVLTGQLASEPEITNDIK